MSYELIVTNLNSNSGKNYGLRDGEELGHLSEKKTTIFPIPNQQHQQRQLSGKGRN